MPDSSSQTLVSAVGAALEPLDGVRVAYVFGSRLGDRARPDSDLDVAIRFSPALDPVSRGRCKLEAIAALTDALGAVGERADIVDIDHADRAVAFRALREGRCALARDPRERVRLEVRVARRYDDDAPRRALFQRAAKACAGHRTGP